MSQSNYSSTLAMSLASHSSHSWAALASREMPNEMFSLAGRAYSRLASASTWTRRFFSDRLVVRVDTRGFEDAWHNLQKTARQLRGTQQRIGEGVAIEGSGAAPVQEPSPRSMSSSSDFPSFLAFFTSRYTIALIVLTLIINRIHATVHVNIPYRSSTKVRLICRLPAILLLTRACLLVIGMMAKMSKEDAVQLTGQGYQFYYSLRSTFEADSRISHADVLWSCFVASCIACANESFIRALDHE